jgi:hypothetical protein
VTVPSPGEPRQAAQPGAQDAVGDLGLADLDVPLHGGQRRLGEVGPVPRLVVQAPQPVGHVQPGVTQQDVAGHGLDLDPVAVAGWLQIWNTQFGSQATPR